MVAARGPMRAQFGAGEYLVDQAAKIKAPTVVTIQVTDRCNYDCVHCYETHGNDPELSLEDFDRILGEIAAQGVLFLTLTGGEFFTRRDADDILRAARKHKFAVKLLTTGHFIDDRRADFLRDLGSIQVDMSFYSASAHTHEQITKIPGSWQRTLTAARRLIERGVTVVLKTPLMQANAATLGDVAEIARKIGAEYAFDPKVTAREDGNQDPLTLRADDATVRNFYRSGIIGVWDKLQEAGEREPPPLSSTPCRAGQATASVTPQGLVYACNVLPIPVGDLREQTFGTIWRESKELDKIRSLTWDKIDMCRDCDVRAYCSRCHAMALLEDGKMDGPSTEACRHAVILRDLLRDEKVIPATETALPPTMKSPRVRLRVLG